MLILSHFLSFTLMLFFFFLGKWLPEEEKRLTAAVYELTGCQAGESRKEVITVHCPVFTLVFIFLMGMFSH